MLRPLIAASAIAGGCLFAPGAYADWGCTVMLCLGDPRGATAEPACRPPIKKLWRELAKGRSMPTCRGPDGVAMRLQSRNDWYDDCPTGTRELRGDATWIAPASLAPRGQVQLLAPPRWSAGTGHLPMEPDGVPRACIAGSSAEAWVPGISDQTGQPVLVYETVHWVEQNPNPWLLDLYHGDKRVATYRPE